MMRLCLRAGERLYVNGAVLRADRKVTLELLNDATFLLETHVLQPAETHTPLRQLYFIIQTLVMEGGDSIEAMQLYLRMMADLRSAVDHAAMKDGLMRVDILMTRRRHFDALRMLRSLFSVEQTILDAPDMPGAPVQENIACR